MFLKSPFANWPEATDQRNLKLWHQSKVRVIMLYLLVMPCYSRAILPHTVSFKLSSSILSRMSSETNGSFAVPLPHRDASVGSKPPVWSLVSPHGNVPLPAKCDRHGREGGVCCKELKDEDDRTLINPDIVRDV
jgi:hypothetical protein